MKTRKQKVFSCLYLAYPGEVTTMDICHVNVGGSEGTRRLREVRSDVRNGEHPPFTDVLQRPSGDSARWHYKLLGPAKQGELFWDKRSPSRRLGREGAGGAGSLRLRPDNGCVY